MAADLVRHPEQVARLRLARDFGISERRLNGWEPRTFQVGYDQAGARVPISEAWEIVTEAEPEWDDRERMKFRALRAYEDGICDCGFHQSLGEDKANHFTFEERICPFCRGNARYERIQKARDEEYEAALGESPPPGVVRLPDGRKTATRLMSPDEVEQRRQRR